MEPATSISVPYQNDAPDATANANTNATVPPATAVSENSLALPTAVPEPADRPWLTFPPFPKPPPGVELIPFKDFKPLGIHVVPPEDRAPDSIEVDGLGIPTLTLRVHHDLTTMEKRKRKNKTKASADGSVRRMVWYDEWAEVETTRRLSAAIDPSSQRSDRLHQAAHDFKIGRPMHQNQELSQLWDRFRVFLGLISSIQPSGQGKKQAAHRHLMATAAEQVAIDDDDEAPDEMPNVSLPEARTMSVTEGTVPPHEVRAQFPAGQHTSAVTEEQRQQRREYRREVRDTKMDRFLNDPEKSVKIFLSGYFRDRGMIFSERMCRDGPILIGFFLNFLLRNRVFPESEKDLRKALAVTEQAKKELLHTFVVSRAIPDGFSKGCALLYGTMTHAGIWATQYADEKNKENSNGNEEPEPEAKRQKTEVDAKAGAEAAVLQAVMGSKEIEVITPEVVLSMEQDMKDLVAQAKASAQDDQGVDTKPGESAEGDNGGAPAGWGATNLDWEDPADAKATDWGAGPTENPLCKYLGPTTLLLTHTTGVIERSTRRIQGIVMPAPSSTSLPKKKGKKSTAKPEPTPTPAPLPDPQGVERELEAQFARMTLVPWHEWDTYDKADVQKPRLLPDSRGVAVTDDCAGAAVSAGPGPVHDPFTHEIVVYLEPDAAEKMLVGMGVDATWIQLARVDPAVPIVVDPEAFNNPWPYGGKRALGAPGVPVELTRIWYMEQVLAVLPSFHTEIIPLPTTEDVFGEDA